MYIFPETNHMMNTFFRLILLVSISLITAITAFVGTLPSAFSSEPSGNSANSSEKQAKTTVPASDAISNPNLAFSAVVSATSQYSAEYAPEFAIDGQVADPHSGDAGTAWCVRGEQAKGKADFVFQWKQPVEASELVYYARTGANFLDEGFKNAEIWLNDETAPSAVCELALKHGPQKIAFPKTTVTKLTRRFLSDFGRANSGAAEILVFSRPATEADLSSAFNPPAQSLESFFEAGLPEEIVFCTRKPGFDPRADV